MAITEQQAWAMPMADLKKAFEAGESIVQPTEKPAEVQQLDKAFADFIAAAPDFQNTEHNAKVLASYIVNPFVATARDFEQAHALAVYRKEYKAPEVQQETDPYKMSLGQLHDAAFGVPTSTDNPFAMDMNVLKKAAGLSDFLE